MMNLFFFIYIHTHPYPAINNNNNNNVLNNNNLNGSPEGLCMNRCEQPDPDFIKMFVGQVPKSMDEDQLREMFEEFGRVHSINVLRDKVTGVSKGNWIRTNFFPLSNFFFLSFSFSFMVFLFLFRFFSLLLVDSFGREFCLFSWSCISVMASQQFFFSLQIFHFGNDFGEAFWILAANFNVLIIVCDDFPLLSISSKSAKFHKRHVETFAPPITRYSCQFFFVYFATTEIKCVFHAAIFSRNIGMLPYAHSLYLYFWFFRFFFVLFCSHSVRLTLPYYPFQFYLSLQWRVEKKAVKMSTMQRNFVLTKLKLIWMTLIQNEGLLLTQWHFELPNTIVVLLLFVYCIFSQRLNLNINQLQQNIWTKYQKVIEQTRIYTE